MKDLDFQDLLNINSALQKDMIGWKTSAKTTPGEKSRQIFRDRLTSIATTRKKIILEGWEQLPLRKRRQMELK